MADFFIRRPIVAMVIAILTVLAGLVALLGLPIAQFPDIVPPLIQINATYTGADAVTIEQSVATPLEQQMNGVDNMLYMKSINANDGTMQLQVSFDIDTLVDMDQVNAQNRVSQASPNLPTDVNQYGVTVNKSFGLPLLVFSVYSPKGTYDGLFLSNYITINMKDVIYRTKGVGQITIFGAADYALRIWVKPDKLAKLGLTVNDLMTAVKQQSNVNPAGKVGGEPAPLGTSMTYTVRAQGRLVDPDQFAQIVVRINPDGSTVRLKDVARLELGALNYNQVASVQGKPAGVIAVYQAPGSNALARGQGGQGHRRRSSRRRFPADIDYVMALDTTLPVVEGIDEIVKTLFEAMILVILVVFLFLQGWRATLIPMIAVPVSLIGTFAVFPLLGFSINTLSLFGLILAIGLVVDDAIVVVEAVEHHIEQGLSPKDATFKAMKEVSGPVVGIALVLSSVFIPVAFMSGIQGRLNKQFAITIAISVLISAFNALTLSPALAALLLRPKKEATGPLAKFFAAFNAWFTRMTGGYVNLSHMLIRKAFLSLVILAGFTLLAGVLGKKIPSSFVPEEDQGYLFANVQLPDAASMQRTNEVMKRVGDVLMKTEGIEYVTAITGFSMLTQISSTNTGFYFISLKEWKDRKGEAMTAGAIMRRVNAALREQIPEAIAFTFGPPAIPGLGNAGGFSFFLQDMSGRDVAYLQENLTKFIGACQKRPELTGVMSPWRASVPQIYVDVDQAKVLKQGVAVGDVYQTLQAYMGGLYVNQFNRFGRQWKVYLQAEGGRQDQARGHEPVLREEQRRGHGPSRFGHDHEADLRPRVHQPLQPIPRRVGHGQRGPRLQLGRRHESVDGGGEGGPAHGHGLRLVRPLLPGVQGLGHGGPRLRPLPRLRLPHPRRALRELVPALQRPALRAHRRGGRLRGPLSAQLRPGRLRPDRPRHAHRPRGQERHPHRGVRQDGVRRARPLPRGCGPGGREAPPPPHPHDLLRLHPGVRAPLDRLGRGGHLAEGPGHRGHRRHAGRHRHRHLHHPRALRPRGAVVWDGEET